LVRHSDASREYRGITGIVTSAVRDTMTNAMLAMTTDGDGDQQQRLPAFPVPQQHEDGIAEHHRAQRDSWLWSM